MPPVTPPPTRSRPSCTGSSRAARRGGSARGAADGVVRPLLTALARGDRRVLPRARPLVAGGLDERRHEARADPGAPAAAPRGARSPRARQPARARDPSGRASHGALEALARRPSLVPGGHPHGRSRRRCPGRPLLRDASPRRGGGVGAVAARERRPRPRRALAPAGGSPRGPLAKGAGCARGREGAEGRARRLAPRRDGGRSGRRRGGARVRRRAGKGRSGRHARPTARPDDVRPRGRR